MAEAEAVGGGVKRLSMPSETRSSEDIRIMGKWLKMAGNQEGVHLSPPLLWADFGYESIPICPENAEVRVTI